ncbi:MAG TPA: 1,2-phenylacetyl-CoA epoxidase subunit PaaE [Pseudomonas sp.]|nr:1,2-phenylacetyl-CoA epoxidase subunit PaaE [Pseudomonas sp.]
MSQFHPLTIREVRAETADAVSVAFAVPPELRDTFRYVQGQHLILRASLDGEEVRRPYSICTSVADDELRVAIKRVAGGRFSNFANDQLRAGQTLEVLPPAGHFFIPLDPARAGRYLAVAAGSGITPILSILKTTLETEPHSRFTLLYGNRSRADTLFHAQLERLQQQYPERLRLVLVFSREPQPLALNNGHIDAAKCDALVASGIAVSELDAAFLCGPQAMTEVVRDTLQRHGLAAERIHFELFNVEASTATREHETAPSAGATVPSQVTLICDGRRHGFALAGDGPSILDAGLAQGLELPYSCKAGVCATCKCRLVEGEVAMDANFALEDHEIAAGYVLCCQAHPRSATVVLDFDQG